MYYRKIKIYVFFLLLLTFSIPMLNLQPAFPMEAGDLTFSLIERRSITTLFSPIAHSSNISIYSVNMSVNIEAENMQTKSSG